MDKKEIKCLNTETNDVITITFTGDIEVMKGLQKQCKRDLENDIENFSEFRLCKRGIENVVYIVKVLDKHNFFSGSLNHYHEIEYITDFEKVVYLDNFTQENIDSWIKIFLSEYEIFRLVENNTITYTIKFFGEVREFKIISKERLLKIIDGLNPMRIYLKLCKLCTSDKIKNHFCCINLKNGMLEFHSLSNNESLHPFNDLNIYLEIINDGLDMEYIDTQINNYYQ